ncbi:MAG: 5-formyltetrahydrofolate cyclo-ligase [Magnetococcales bacterium]|nr:5-formyltetrahydrofolate cyclo-ligase [Magnetococcales bacterium]
MEGVKAATRKGLRQRRRALSAERAAALGEAINRHATTLPIYRHARHIGLYMAVENEVNPSSLLADLHHHGKKVYLPIVDKKARSLGFVPYQPGDPLTQAAFGIPEPTLRTGLISAGEIRQLDLLFMPLVGFDRSGGRLGYGGGYYDRLLAPLALSKNGVNQTPGGTKNTGKRPLLVGLAYAFQEVESLPWEPYDVPMDHMVTENGVLTADAQGFPPTGRKEG